MASANKVITLTGDQLKHCIASFARECFCPETIRGFTNRYVPARDVPRGDILSQSRADIGIRSLLRAPFGARMDLSGKMPSQVQFRVWQTLWDLHGEIDLTACYGIHVQWWPSLIFRLNEGRWPICVRKPDQAVKSLLLQRTQIITLSDSPPEAPDLERWLGVYFDERLEKLS